MDFPMQLEEPVFPYYAKFGRGKGNTWRILCSFWLTLQKFEVTWQA